MIQAFQIIPWNELPQIKWNSLLLGNGASIALHPGFGYPSLLEVARGQNLLPTSDTIFTSLNTTDFEQVLQVCWHASIVNSALGQPVNPIAEVYREVRDALICSVRQVHCLPDALGDSLTQIGTFGAKFDIVVTFNYDLTIYWAMMQYNETNGVWFKDAFIDRVFDANWSRLRAAYGVATGATLVFYAHGSLVLGRLLFGQEYKLVAQQTALPDQTALLDTVTEAWRQGTSTPLFVSEGTAASKFASIRRSPYLSTVYDDVLTTLGDAAVVYGLSFSANDQHIIEAIKRRPPRLLAISVFSGMPELEQQAYCHNITAKLQVHLPMTQVVFFDSQSSGCWNNP